MIIRNETEFDVAEIFEVTRRAFEGCRYSNGTEPFIVNALRSAKALTISLVAEIDGKVVGHIAFSPVAISDGSGDWYGVGPLSVLPELQRQGLGKALVSTGLSLLRALDANGCVLVGDPLYYERFGFRNIPELIHEGIPQEVFLALPFGHFSSRGTVTFHEGFAASA